MKRHILFLIPLILALALDAAAPRKKDTSSRPRAAVDIEVIKDSALLLADDYASALADKPEFASIRLNALKAFHDRRPAAVGDSVRAVLFNYVVYYIGCDNTARAEAFKDCFLALAPDDDSRLGPLYAMQLAVAREDFDTVAANKYIVLLDDYARRMNFDYDEDLRVARDFVGFMRDKRPVNEELVGVWVGEGICSDKLLNLSVWQILSDLDDNSGKFDEQKRASHILVITPSRIMFTYPLGINYKDFPQVGYKIPDEVESEGKYKKRKSFFWERISPHSWLYKDDWYIYVPQKIEYDENLRSAYCVWSNQDISSFNHEFYAVLRQNMQASTARALGNMARKGVSNSRRLWGGAAVNAMNIIGNSLLDLSAVSTSVYWAREATIRIDSPGVLTVWNYFQYNMAKSNSNQVKSWTVDEQGHKYYRWEPDDNVFFLRQGYSDPVTLGEPDKQRKKAMKQYVKEAKTRYEAQFGKVRRKVEDYNAFYNWFNTQMFNKLKSKTEKL